MINIISLQIISVTCLKEIKEAKIQIEINPLKTTAT